MKRIFLFAAFSLLAQGSFAQGMYGAQLGLGFGTGYSSKLTPNLDFYGLHKIIYRVYAGGDLSIQRYSLFQTVNRGGTASYGDIINVTQKTTYAFLSAKVDYAIGYRKYFHINISYGPGIFIGGHQYSSEHLPQWYTVWGPVGADTTSVNTSYNIPTITFKGSIGFSERIPTHGFWNIMLSQEFHYLPGNLSKDGPAFNTSYITFGVGIMHKYPLVFVEY